VPGRGAADDEGTDPCFSKGHRRGSAGHVPSRQRRQGGPVEEPRLSAARRVGSSPPRAAGSPPPAEPRPLSSCRCPGGCLVGAGDQLGSGHAGRKTAFLPGRVPGLAPGGISGSGEGKARAVNPQSPSAPHCCASLVAGRGGLWGLCSAHSQGLISINKANRLKPWPLLALPPSPPLPVAPKGGPRLAGTRRSPRERVSPTPSHPGQP